LLVGRLLYAPFEHGDLARSALAATLYVSNIAFARSSIDYLAETDRSPLLHTWSLGVEEQFYLFWPAIVWLAYAAHRRADGRRLVSALTLVGVASYALCVWLTGRMQPFAFFLLPTRAWEFALGALACMLTAASAGAGPPASSGAIHAASAGAGRVASAGADRDASVSAGRAASAGVGPTASSGARHVAIATWIGLLAIAAAGLGFDASTPFPGAIALIPAGGTALLLLAGARDARSGPVRALTTPVMQWLGRLSYSWYLW